ncbi:MAG: hypothetical protein CVV18_02270 [Gammaproteobacteria bacterium HGW-Gammaproteobacteria-8]|nr:MAG: hypothetical protein CVV18_02270 [Gammaproteobacteria bacterium HGW-Gammaproteobacteria-8]
MKASEPVRLERLAERLHLPIALLSLWLLATSPWVGLRRVIPDDPGFWNWNHLLLGLLMLPLALVYLAGNLVQGRWREHFPWLVGNLDSLGRDLAGLLRARLPAAGGAGLFSVIQGLLLLALVATALTGLGWFLSEGSRAALAWRDWHISVAWSFGVLLLLHVLSASAHLLYFLRD